MSNLLFPQERTNKCQGLHLVLVTLNWRFTSSSIQQDKTNGIGDTEYNIQRSSCVLLVILVGNEWFQREPSQWVRREREGELVQWGLEWVRYVLSGATTRLALNARSYVPCGTYVKLRFLCTALVWKTRLPHALLSYVVSRPWDSVNPYKPHVC